MSEDGEDGGVVYCEMQGRENSGESLAHYNLMQLAYSKSGYSAETGGIMRNLRTSTTNTKVGMFCQFAFIELENKILIHFCGHCLKKFT